MPNVSVVSSIISILGSGQITMTKQNTVTMGASLYPQVRLLGLSFWLNQAIAARTWGNMQNA